MAASTITRDFWTNDTGTFAAPNGDGTAFENDVLQNHIYARIDQMFAGAGAYATFTFGGLIAAEGGGTHAFDAGPSGGNLIRVRNTTAGLTNFASLDLGNDSASAGGRLRLTSTTFSATGTLPQDGLNLACLRVGGLAIAAEHASGTIRFYSGGIAERARLDAAGFLGIGATPTWNLHLSGAGQTTAALADAGNKGGAIYVRDSGGAAGNGGAVVFAASQGHFAAIKGHITDGTTNTIGDLCFATRALVASTSLTERMRLTSAGLLCIGDTSNAKAGIGLTVNQDNSVPADEILTLKNTNVSHAMTDETETDSFAAFTMKSANGGLKVAGFADSGGQTGLELGGRSTGVDGTKSTAGVGVVQIDAALHNGATGIASIGSNGNILAVRDNGTARFILDADGDSHQDVGTTWTNFDTHDDLALLNGISAALARKGDPLRRMFGGWLRQNRAELERLRLVTFNRNGHHFVNWPRMHMVVIGGVRQVWRDVVALTDRFDRLTARLEALEALV